MPKSIALKNLDLQKRAQLVAHLKHVRLARATSGQERAPDGSIMNANVRAVLEALENIYLKK